MLYIFIAITIILFIFLYRNINPEKNNLFGKLKAVCLIIFFIYAIIFLIFDGLHRCSTSYKYKYNEIFIRR